MTLNAFKDLFIQKLNAVTDKDEAAIFFYICIEELFGISKTKFLTHETELTPNEEGKLLDVLSKLEKHQPIQYIFNKTHFYGNVFKVTSDTLIPRPETEELIEKILERTSENSAVKILDIGTGSGCIPITLAKHLPLAKIQAMDISAKALEVAKENAQLLNTTIDWIEQDVLKLEKLAPLDIIISNPPYVQLSEKAEMKPNVLNFEPHSALFVPENNPLIFYKKIIKLADISLNIGGVLYLEINQYLAEETLFLFNNYSFSQVEIFKDLKQNQRMIVACK